MEPIKRENKILLMLAFFSISIGLWGNFRQLWLQDNGFSPSDISNVLSIGTLASVIGIFFVAKYIKLDKLKKFISITLFFKFLNLIILYLLNGTVLRIGINISVVLDIVIEYIIITSIYPLITTIIKSNKIYSKRKLTEYLFRDIGILFGGIFIGKIIFGRLVDYNMCLVISNIFLLIATFTMFNIKIYNTVIPNAKRIGANNYLFKDKILIVYLVYVLVTCIANFTALGLKMLILTNYYNFSDNIATNYLLVIGLMSDILGIIALKFLTPKNDYVTMTIKFGIRFIGYLLAFLSNNLIITFIAITWSILIGAAYEDVCDGPYINSVKTEYQLSFSNIRYIVRFLGEAIGVFFCGIMYEKGFRYMFGLSAFFMIFQLSLCYMLIYMRKNKKIDVIRIICQKNPNIEYIERKCAYAIIENDNGNISIANDGKYFFFGGGTEKNETALETLKRELLEETGYTIKDINLFDKIVSYEYNDCRGNLKIVATIYIAKFDKKISEPIEKDHKILCGKPEEYINKMYHKYQRVILKEYNDMKKGEEVIC